MTRFGMRKDGRRYPKSVGDPSKGISDSTFRKLKEMDARRSRIAKVIDNKKKATIDYEGEHWKGSPNRYDVKGIDDPATAKKIRLPNGKFAFRIGKKDEFELVE